MFFINQNSELQSRLPLRKSRAGSKLQSRLPLRKSRAGSKLQSRHPELVSERQCEILKQVQEDTTIFQKGKTV